MPLTDAERQRILANIKAERARKQAQQRQAQAVIPQAPLPERPTQVRPVAAAPVRVPVPQASPIQQLNQAFAPLTKPFTPIRQAVQQAVAPPPPPLVVAKRTEIQTAHGGKVAPVKAPVALPQVAAPPLPLGMQPSPSGGPNFSTADITSTAPEFTPNYQNAPPSIYNARARSWVNGAVGEHMFDPPEMVAAQRVETLPVKAAFGRGAAQYAASITPNIAEAVAINAQANRDMPASEDVEAYGKAVQGTNLIQHAVQIWKHPLGVTENAAQLAGFLLPAIAQSLMLKNAGLARNAPVLAAFVFNTIKNHGLAAAAFGGSSYVESFASDFANKGIDITDETAIKAYITEHPAQFREMVKKNLGPAAATVGTVLLAGAAGEAVGSIADKTMPLGKAVLARTGGKAIPKGIATAAHLGATAANTGVFVGGEALKQYLTTGKLDQAALDEMTLAGLLMSAPGHLMEVAKLHSAGAAREARPTATEAAKVRSNIIWHDLKVGDSAEAKRGDVTLAGTVTKVWPGGKVDLELGNGMKAVRVAPLVPEKGAQEAISAPNVAQMPVAAPVPEAGTETATMPVKEVKTGEGTGEAGGVTQSWEQLRDASLEQAKRRIARGNANARYVERSLMAMSDAEWEQTADWYLNKRGETLQGAAKIFTTARQNQLEEEAFNRKEFSKGVITTPLEDTPAEVTPQAVEPTPTAQPAEQPPAPTVATPTRSSDMTTGTRDTSANMRPGGQFHGTSEPIDNLGYVYDRRQAHNLYGPGFYTSDDIGVVAGAGEKKGYTSKGKGTNPTVYKVEWVSDKPKSLLNLDKALPDNAVTAIQEAVGELLPIDAKQPGSAIYADIKAAMRDNEYTRDDAEELMGAISDNLYEIGYSGFQHIGGKVTGGDSHNVEIYFHPIDPYTSVPNIRLTKWEGGTPFSLSAPEPTPTPRPNAQIAQAAKKMAEERGAESEPQPWSPEEQRFINNAEDNTGWERTAGIGIAESQLQFRRSTQPDIGKWNPKLAGTVLVWRDTQGEIGAKGKLYVADGHHRLMSAKALNVPAVKVEYMPDGMTVQQAREYAAMRNIAVSPNLDPVDVAKFLRETSMRKGDVAQFLRDQNINLSGRRAPLLQTAMDLSKLPEGIFEEMYRANNADATKAAREISRTLRDGTPILGQADQQALWQSVMKDMAAGRDINTRQIKASVDQMAKARQEAAQTGWNFDTAESITRGRVISKLEDYLHRLEVRGRHTSESKDAYKPTDEQLQQHEQFQNVLQLVKDGAELTTPMGKRITALVKNILAGGQEDELVQQFGRSLWEGDFVAENVNDWKAGGTDAGAESAGTPARHAVSETRTPPAADLGVSDLKLFDNDASGNLFGPTTAVEMQDRATSAPPAPTEAPATPAKKTRSSGGTSALRATGALTLPRSSTGTGSLDHPIRQSDIVRDLHKALVPIRTGRFLQRALGIFKVKPEVVRVGKANNLPVIAHEVGHALQKMLFPNALTPKGDLSSHAFPRAFWKELAPLAYPGADKKITEGYAEFMRLYLTDPAQAKTRAPKFFDHFTAQMAKFPQVQRVIERAQEHIRLWTEQPAAARVRGTISRNEPSSKSALSLERLYTQFVDELRPIQRAEGDINADVAAEQSPYLAFWKARGVSGKAETWLTRGVTNAQGKVIARGLKQVLKPVAKDLDAFSDYMISRHALDVIDTLGQDAMPLPREDYQEVVNAAPAHFADVLRGVVKFQHANLETLVQSGLISREQVDAMKAKWPHHVPLYRVMEKETRSNGIGRGAANKQSPIRRLKGSGRDIIDPLESIVKDTFVIHNLAARNEAMVKLVRLGEQTEGAGKWVERVPTPRRATKVTLGEVLKVPEHDPLWADLYQLAQLEPDQTAVIFRPNNMPVGKENIVRVFIDGDARLYQLDPDLHAAVTAEDALASNVLMQLIAKPAGWLRAGATLTPDFGLRNPVRDAFEAFVYSEHGMTPVDWVRGLFSAVKKDDLYQQWKAMGGAHAALVSADRSYLQNAVRGLAKQTTGEHVIDLATHPIEALRALSEFTEEATRLAEYGKGVSWGKEKRLGKLIEAAVNSRDVTLDFSRAGTIGKQVNKLVAFWNANVQGVDKMIRQFRTQPRRTTLRALAYITVPTLLLYALNRRDERYKELPDWQKDMFWIIPTPKVLVRIPRPFLLGMLFGAIPERIARWIDERDPHAFDDLAANMLDTMKPGLIPTALEPWIRVRSNKNYSGVPIVPRREQDLAKPLQYGPNTTGTARAVGSLLNASPRQLDEYTRGYLGGLGMYASQGVGAVLEKTGIVKTPTRPSLGASDIPGVRGFTVNPMQTPVQVERLYDRLASLKEKQQLADAQAGKALTSQEATELATLTGRAEVLTLERNAERDIMDSESLKRVRDIAKDWGVRVISSSLPLAKRQALIGLKKQLRGIAEGTNKLVR